ncbi:MAG: 5'/3'-nucleotidase SurE [Verrucomicrobiota bacterium]
MNFEKMSSVLVTNDDGIDAEGIGVMARIAQEFFDQVWVIAPNRENSQIGHKVTTYEPISVEKRANRIYSIGGTPADCTRVGMAHLMPQKPDWIWSGINHGGNLGKHDYFISGTMAAVREGSFAGIPGMGASHFLRRGVDLDWDAAGERLRQSFLAILAEEKPLEWGEMWCVNLPHVEPNSADPEIRFCDAEPQPLEVKFEQTEEGLIYKGSYPDRPRSPSTDVDVCFGGNIAITKCYC